MNTDFGKAYELLGVKPGVSNRELKAAHRDLAKVWHPDRFIHDPRLQEKAQEKLKEINEAYELLISGKTPRPRPAAAEPSYSPTRSRSGSGKWAAVVPVLLFIAVFAVTTKVLLERRSQPLPQVEAEPVQVETATPTEPGTRAEVTRKPSRNDEPVAEENTVSTATPSEPTPALATVTVVIDPESGLLAKADCRVRSRMTYPRGNEPTTHCTISHTPPPKESKIKSLTEKILR